MDENKINEKLDKIIETQTDMKVELAEIRKGYDYHVYRTDLAEDNINLLRLQQDTNFKQVQEQIEPLKTFKDRSMGAIKLFILLVSVAGVLVGLLRFFTH